MFNSHTISKFEVIQPTTVSLVNGNGFSDEHSEPLISKLRRKIFAVLA